MIAAAAIALVGSLALLWRRPHDGGIRGQQTTHRSAATASQPALSLRVPDMAAANSGHPSSPRPPEPGPLPASLQDTDVDGWLGVDDAGHLVVTPGARWFFEYFLSATGEESAQEIRVRIIAEINKRLPAAGAQEAIALLDRYLAYRQRAQEMTATESTTDLEQRLRQLQDIRRQVFGDADAAALFGEEENILSVDIARARVLHDDSLSPQERQRQLDELEQQLPEPARAARAQAMGPLQLAQDEADLRAQGADPEEVRALRESRFGSEAADRLEGLDRERAEWDRRVADYRAAREGIEADQTLTAEQRARAADELKGQRFTPTERLRIEALDRIAQQHP